MHAFDRILNPIKNTSMKEETPMNQHQQQFDHKISSFTKSLASTRTITQYKRLGELCEKFQLYALAAQTFRKLACLDPSNKHQHGIRFLQNLQEAIGCGCYTGNRSPLNN